jgi:MOSC domain-containing protein YiiM
MERLESVTAIAEHGLAGDRYSVGEGSFNKGRIGASQVTLINALFFRDSGFLYEESRRNIVTDGVELMWLIGREFTIGAARMRGVKYCDPCKRPTKLVGSMYDFQARFFDRGGLVAEVLEGGLICVGDSVVPPPKGY